jgi:hypothetical protein
VFAVAKNSLSAASNFARSTSMLPTSDEKNESGALILPRGIGKRYNARKRIKVRLKIVLSSLMEIRPKDISKLVRRWASIGAGSIVPHCPFDWAFKAFIRATKCSRDLRSNEFDITSPILSFEILLQIHQREPMAPPAAKISAFLPFRIISLPLRIRLQAFIAPVYEDVLSGENGWMPTSLETNWRR